jgi:hypothetical protein
MIDQQTSAKQWTDADIEKIYNKLLTTTNEKSEQKIPPQWNPSEFQIVSGYAVRVAQNSTLPEFKQFIRTGLPVNPVKMSPAEMELLQGGSHIGDYFDNLFGTIGRAVHTAVKTIGDAI